MPKSVLSRRRSWVARLAVLALIASTLVVGAVPASAATTPSNPATYSACVGPATASAGFADTAGNFAASDINCIKYYGVTQGTTATTFSPSQVVTRWQMALFLTRAAGPAGITLPDGSDQGFTDIGHLDAATQKAINQLKQLGITQGTTATTFSPDAPVTRAQMALFIGRFLNAAVTGPGGTAWTSASTTNLPGFTDIGNLTVEAYNSVVKLWNLGVTTGTSATTFSPTATVTRAQMAAFIARALAHTNARPAGVTIQSNLSSGFVQAPATTLSPTLSVTVRDANFQPVANALVDVFRFVPSLTVTSPFDANGNCVATSEVSTVSSGANKCKIDLTDNATDQNGNVSLTGSVAEGTTATFYAWTGTAGTVFDNDTTASSNVAVTANFGAEGTRVTNTIPVGATDLIVAGNNWTNVRYGQTVTFTVQLLASDVAPSVTNPTVSSQPGVNVTVTETRYAEDGTTVLSVKTTTLKSDSNGQVTYSVTDSDPNTGTWVSGTATDNEGLVRVQIDGPGTLGDADVRIAFNDDPAKASSQTVSSTQWVQVNASGATASATTTVLDQYGSGIGGVSVSFTSTGVTDGLGSTAVVRTTNSAGQASVSWTRTTTTTAKETVTSAVTGLSNATDDTYWVEAPGVTTGGSLGTAGTNLVVPTEAYSGTASDNKVQAQIVAVDTANDKFVVEVVYDNDPAPAPAIDSRTVYVVYSYDSNDAFFVGGAAKTFAEWETALDGLTTLPKELFDTTNNGKLAVSSGASEYRMP